MGLRRGVSVVAVVTMLVALLPGIALAARPCALRALSYNIHTGIGVDGRLELARIARVITASGADVVGLQEVDVHWSARSGHADQVRELARLTGMHAFFAPIYDLDPEPGHTERRRYGVAFLSTYPILDAQNHRITRLSTVDPDPTPKQAPGFGEIVLPVRGARVHAYVTHLDFRPDPWIRRTQVAETVRILDRHRRTARQILLGDFNAEPAAPELAPLVERMPDSWARVHGSGNGGLTYPADAPAKRLDFVTSSAVLHPTSAEVLDTQASDHRPVLAEFSLCPYGHLRGVERP